METRNNIKQNKNNFKFYKPSYQTGIALPDHYQLVVVLKVAVVPTIIMLLIVITLTGQDILRGCIAVCSHNSCRYMSFVSVRTIFGKSKIRELRIVILKCRDNYFVRMEYQ